MRLGAMFKMIEKMKGAWAPPDLEENDALVLVRIGDKVFDAESCSLVFPVGHAPVVTINVGKERSDIQAVPGHNAGST